MKALSSVRIFFNEVKHSLAVSKESCKLHSSVVTSLKINTQLGWLCSASHLKSSHLTVWCRSYSFCWTHANSTPINWKSTITFQRITPLPLKDANHGTQTIKLPICIQQMRWKSKKRPDSVQNNSESDSDDDDDALALDDFDAPAKFKVLKIHTPSMRTDAIISNSLDVSRSRLEEMFYGPGLLLNGVKMLKKSIKMEEGDYVDLVVDKIDEQYKVKRVKIIKIYFGKTNTEKLNVKVRVWKTPFLVNNPGNGRRSS